MSSHAIPGGFSVCGGRAGDEWYAGVLVLGGSFSMIDKATLQKIIEEQDYTLLARELAFVKQFIDRLRQEKYPGLDFAQASLEQIRQATGRNFNFS